VAIVAVAIGFRVVFYEIDLTTAFFVLILAPEVYLPVRQVGVHYHDAADGMAAAESAFAIIESTPPVEPVETTPARPGEPGFDNPRQPGSEDPPLIRIAGLTHRYPGGARVLDGVDLEVNRGELAVITGASGSGKTTLLHALMGFIEPTAGAFGVDGVPADAATRRNRIAWVAQNPGMINGTIADNVRLGAADASDADVRLSLQRAGGSSLDPDRGVGDDGEGLSAGERRRVAVARAALRVSRGPADLLVLDEPTAGLDRATEDALLDALSELDVTILAVSHRSAVIARADRVLHLEPRSAGGLGAASHQPDLY